MKQNDFIKQKKKISDIIIVTCKNEKYITVIQ